MFFETKTGRFDPPRIQSKVSVDIRHLVDIVFPELVDQGIRIVEVLLLVLVEYQVQDWRKEEREHCSGHHSSEEGKCDRLDHLRAFAREERHRNKSYDRRDSRHQDRTEPSMGSLQTCLFNRRFVFYQAVYAVDENNTVVDDNTYECNYTDKGEEAEALSHEDVHPDYTDQQQRDRRKDDERVHEALELGCHDQ